jgi:general secretion pathway protein C
MSAIQLSSQQVLRWLQGQGMRRLAWLVNLLLVVWVAYLLAEVTWLLVPRPELQHAALGRAAPVQPAQDKAAADGQAVARLHLFGEAPTDSETAEVEPVAPVDAPETQLKLTLYGVFASEDKGEAWAIVADPRGEEQHYGIGDPLPGGAELVEVYPDRIILRRSGRYETLKLPQEEKLGGAQAAAARAPASASSRTPSGEVLRQYRQTLRNDPQSLMSLVRPQPVRENGQFLGFRLLPGRDKEFLQQVGLQAGDIVTAINGVKLDSPVKGVRALQALAEGDQVSLDLQRDGESLALSFQVPQ